MDISRGELVASSPGSQSVDTFLAALGSGSPVPGGGAAAALCGALAAALVAMVCRVTAEREPSARDEVTRITARADQLRRRLVELVDEDMVAYRGVLQSRAKAPGAAASGQDAHRRATEVPLLLARASRDVLALCEAAAKRARTSTLSDLGVAAALAWGALESSALTARVNLKELRDAEFVRASQRELGDLLAEGEGLRHRVSTRMQGLG